MKNKIIILFFLIVIVIVPFVYAPDLSIAECKSSATHSDGETGIYNIDGKDFEIFTHIEVEDKWASFKVNGNFGEKTSQFSEQWGNPLMEGETIIINGLKITVIDIGRVEGGTEEYVSFCYKSETGEECTDSDNGINYYLKGTCKDIVRKSYTDYCDNDNKYLNEYACNSVGGCYGTHFLCPNGCNNGACLPEEPEPVSECPTGCICEGNIIECPTEEELCTDSDGGKNYYVKGETTQISETYGGGTSYDSCDHNILREQYCGEDNLITEELYTCPNGCKDGACVEDTYTCPTNQKVVINNVRNSNGKIAVDYTIGPKTNAVEIWFGLASGADLRKCSLGLTGTCSIAVGQSYTSCSVVTECSYPTDREAYMVKIKDGKCSSSDTYKFSGATDDNIYVYLNQKFELKQGLTAIVKDYKNMGIKYIADAACPICSPCTEGHLCEPCPPCEKKILLQVEIPGDCKPSSTNLVEECTSQATEFYIKAGEIKSVSGAEIKLVDYHNGIAVLLVTKETSHPGGIYVKLGEKFTLAEGGSAKVTDYSYMKIRLDKIVGSVVSVQVEMPSVCEDETCSEGVGTEFNLKQGESKNIFGAKLTFLGLIKETPTWKVYAAFIVEKSSLEGGVDVEIIPNQQTISYGEKAVYKVRVTDKHAAPECPVGAQCKPTAPLTYQIHIKNLPFLKEYPTEIFIPYGGSKSFELVVKPYELIEPVAVEEEQTPVITGSVIETSTGKKVVSKPVKKVMVSQVGGAEEAVTSIAAPVERVEEEILIEPIQITQPSNLIRKYKFSVTATLKDNYKIQDTANALLSIKPHSPQPPVTPPPFPGEKVPIKLYKGWNLISLPGKLIKFGKEGLRKNQKLIGFVYIKEKQKYFSLKEAENILGDKLKEYLAKNAFWIYSRNPMTLNVWVDRKISFEELELVKGWNLVPITEDMLGGYLTDILGDCSLDKIYLWDAEKQGWDRIDLKYSFADYQLGYGFLIKARDYCKLVGPEIIAPPPMPEEEG